jgi:hypothetical protein
MVSDVKMLYMSLSKEDEIRILGNLAVQLLASLQFLSNFISELCREVREPNPEVYDPLKVSFLREFYKLGNLEIRSQEFITHDKQNSDSLDSNYQNNSEKLTKSEKSKDEVDDDLKEDSVETKTEDEQRTDQINKKNAILPKEEKKLKDLFQKAVTESDSDYQTSEDEWTLAKKKQKLRRNYLYCCKIRKTGFAIQNPQEPGE